MSGIARGIRVLAVVAVFAALAGACGKSITGPSPDNGDGDPICILVNGNLICR
jgi:hypothetical protein